tara:strand:- start:18231 stop:18524 length:294 start_codon:yes stop_codon:yes gene_type:complete
MDATTDGHRHVHRIVEYANELYDELNVATSAHRRMRLASMCLALYTVLLETENVARTVIDRIAQCDVHRRKRRLQRMVETLSVPTGTESVSSMLASA